MSSLGRIRSLPRVERFLRMGTPCQRRLSGGLLTPATNTDGYLHVSLRINGKLRMARIHKLVAIAFHGPGNELHNEVAHLDGNPTNARADNLKWVSRVENESHKLVHGTRRRGEQAPNAKHTDAQARLVKRLLAKGTGATVAARVAKTSYSFAHCIAEGKSWRHI